MKKAVVALSLVGIWLSLAPVEAQTKRKVVFGVPVTPPNVVHIPPYVAKEMGFFAENNIDAEFVTFEGGTQTLRGSVAGGLDITGTSSDPAIIAAARGAGTKVLQRSQRPQDRHSGSRCVQRGDEPCRDGKLRTHAERRPIYTRQHQGSGTRTSQRANRHGDSSRGSGARGEEEKIRS